MSSSSSSSSSSPRIINVSSSLEKSRRLINDTSLPPSIRTRLLEYAQMYPIWRMILNQQYDTYVKTQTTTHIKTQHESSDHIYLSNYLPSTDPGLIALLTRHHHSIYLSHLHTQLYRFIVVVALALLVHDINMSQSDHKHKTWAPVFPTISMLLVQSLKLYTLYIHRTITSPSLIDLIIPIFFIVTAPVVLYGYFHGMWAGVWVPGLALLSGIGVPFITTYRSYYALKDDDSSSASNTIRIEYHVYRVILYLGAMTFLMEHTSPIYIPLAPVFPFLQIITACIMRWRWNNTVGRGIVDIWDHVLLYGPAGLACIYLTGYLLHYLPGILIGHLALTSSCLFQLRACSRQQHEWAGTHTNTTHVTVNHNNINSVKAKAAKKNK